MIENRDIILTGVPRSGTTLACLLLSKLPNTVALNEPMRTARHKTRPAALAAIPEFYAETRRSILERGVAVARAVDGRMTDNHFAQVKGKRVKRVQKQEIAVQRPADRNFRLACKHNAFFTILQDDLDGRYPYYAIVRDPLAVLASWQSVDIPASRGEVRAMNHLLPEKAAELDRAGDVIDRQLFILNWYFGRYAALRPEQVIRYEDIVATNGGALSVIDSAAAELDEDLSSRNKSKAYNWESMGPIRERLLASEGAYWQFYAREEI